ARSLTASLSEAAPRAVRLPHRPITTQYGGPTRAPAAKPKSPRATPPGPRLTRRGQRRRANEEAQGSLQDDLRCSPREGDCPMIGPRHAELLSGALADLLGSPIPGDVAFVRCLPSNLVDALIDSPAFFVTGWTISAVVDVAGARRITA